MENENKCFFSISLENGIIITGENPDIVKDYLMDLYSAFEDCKIASQNDGFQHFANKMEKYEEQIIHAAHLISKNYKQKKKR